MTTKFILLFLVAQVTRLIDIETPFVPWWRGNRVLTGAMDERSPEKKSKRQKKFTLFIGIKC